MTKLVVSVSLLWSISYLIFGALLCHGNSKCQLFIHLVSELDVLMHNTCGENPQSILSLHPVRFVCGRNSLYMSHIDEVSANQE